MGEIDETAEKAPIIVKNEEFRELLDKDRALILAIQELTNTLNRLRSKL